MKYLLKRKIGQCSRSIAEWLPASRPYLSNIGLRTSEGCFANRPATIWFRSRPAFKLCRVDENYLSFQLFWRGGDFYEPITRSLLEALAGSCQSFVDIGANVGFFSISLATLKPSLHVFAFEPNPKNYVILKENLALNGLGNVVAEPSALSKQSGSATLFLSESDMSASLVPNFQPEYTIQTGCATVHTLSLDEFFSTNLIPQPIFLKIDVEGHEDAVFSGALRTLSEYDLDLVVEVLSEHEPSFAETLRHLGYSFYRITDQGLIKTTKLVRYVRPPFEFLNCLITRRSQKEINTLAARIEPTVRKLNLLNSSKYFPERYPAVQSSQFVRENLSL